MIDSSSSSQNSGEAPGERADEHPSHGNPGRQGGERHSSEHRPHAHEREEDGHHPGHVHEVVIQIDRTPYKEVAREVTGADIRRIPSPHIPPDRDLFEVVPGAPDLKVLDTTTVRLRDGQRFFTAPGQINPGSDTSMNG